MNNKGFTLIEVISVIAILGIIATIGVVGSGMFKNASELTIFDGKKEHLLLGAKNYGTDFKVLLTETCYVKEKIINNCKEITVGDITDYIRIIEDCDGNKCYQNNITKKDMKSDELIVYLENDLVYAEFVDIKSCNVDGTSKCE